ncbi:MAG: hypothetical protein C0392_07845 [Syntrophus sp. (in: bacteria)]|nr:hypothetical protein [Syntrophus sp. (in: bacteria)]
MFITEGRTNYDGIFDKLLSAYLHNADDKSIETPFFQDLCTIRADGIFADHRRIDTIGGILILRYMMRQSDHVPAGNDWVPYREFKDGSSFASYIKTHIEDQISRQFSGRQDALIEAFNGLGGIPFPSEARPDLSMIVRPFPKIPVLSLFWDQDEEFPSSFQFLFDRSAPAFLDMESLAVLLRYIYLKITA